MQAVFVELPAFEKRRYAYLADEGLRRLQVQLLADPECGDVMPGTGGLRKMRFADARRGKGKRGGLRVIYFWWKRGCQLWLFTIYDKDEIEDLSAKEKRLLKAMLEAELRARQ